MHSWVPEPPKQSGYQLIKYRINKDNKIFPFKSNHQNVADRRLQNMVQNARKSGKASATAGKASRCSGKKPSAKSSVARSFVNQMHNLVEVHNQQKFLNKFTDLINQERIKNSAKKPSPFGRIDKVDIQIQEAERCTPSKLNLSNHKYSPRITKLLSSIKSKEKQKHRITDPN